MDVKTSLSGYSREQLRNLERNALDIARKFPDTHKGESAEEMLRQISEERARRSVPGNVASFLAEFPGGFDDERYKSQERNDKSRASSLCREVLSVEVFQAAEASSDHAEIVLNIKRVVNATNLVQGSFEKPKLFDAIQDVRNTAGFVAALGTLMHGEDEVSGRLEAFSDYLHTLGLRKWTYGTYFLFMNDPSACMFVKPEGLKKALDIAEYPLDYDSVPTAKLYRQILGFAEWIDRQLRRTGDRNLVPKDMIDVQSFIWHMAPTGKFAR